MTSLSQETIDIVNRLAGEAKCIEMPPEVVLEVPFGWRESFPEETNTCAAMLAARTSIRKAIHYTSQQIRLEKQRAKDLNDFYSVQDKHIVDQVVEVNSEPSWDITNNDDAPGLFYAFASKPLGVIASPQDLVVRPWDSIQTPETTREITNIVDRADSSVR